jgi:hypothetical protein
MHSCLVGDISYENGDVSVATNFRFGFFECRQRAANKDDTFRACSSECFGCRTSNDATLSKTQSVSVTPASTASRFFFVNLQLQ